MNQIRAFVGHSFTENDAGVVDAFLTYFGQIQNLLPSFTWTHARAAEPTELAKKVLSLVEDTNLFIGICTKKERVIANDKLQPPAWLGRDLLQAQAADFEWKTSDWIIQEVGLAVGRGMSVILLVENGCRRPGGIQGDVEFIPFDRAAPEKAFGQLLEMLKALTPALPQVDTASTDSGPEPSDEIAAPAATDDTTPDETWDRSKYEITFAWKLFTDKLEAASEIDAAYLRTPESKDPEKKAEWQSLTEIWRIRFGKGGTLQRLRELKEEFPENVSISTNLAAALAHFDQHDPAAREYLSTANSSKLDPIEAASLRGSAAVQLLKSGQRNASDGCLDELRGWVNQNPSEEARLLHVLKEIAEADNDETLATQVMERMLDLQPDDFSLRFELAYKYSQLKNDDLSLHHYLQIPATARTPMAWNNLGAAFQKASLPAKSIDAYRTAASENETLAMSNLAYKLMDAGFLAEADAELQKALKIDNFHRNVPEALTQLRDIPEKENSGLEAAQTKAKPKVDFFRRLGKALARPAVAELASKWVGPNCELTVEIKGGWLFAAGQYERENSGLGSALSGVKTKTTYSVNYAGKIAGRRVFGVVKTTSKGPFASAGALSLLGDGDGVDFGMIISDDASSISVMESPSSVAPRFYEMTPSALPPALPSI